MSGAVTLPPYPEYQSVDDTWFDRIPAHWKATALRGVLNQRNEKNNPIKTTQILSLSIAHGVTLYSDRGRGGNKRKGDLSAYKIAHEGDIVLNSMNVIVGAVGLSRYTGAISPVYYALYPNTIEASITYYDKVFSNPVFQRYLMIYGRGILIKKSDSGKFNTIRMKISPNDLKGTLLPLPPRTEQEQIVAYMRAQDAHIARFIKTKRDLIKLLTEQKLRIIDHAVTRGLDPAVALKPSGIEWLGEVPEHWELRRLKFLANNVTNQTTTKANDEIYLALEHVESWTGVARPLQGDVEFASTVKRFVTDDVLFGKLRPYLAKVTRAVRAGVCVSEFLVLRSRKDLVLPAYLEQLLRCKRVIDLINSSTAGAKMPRADWTFIGNVRLAVPPVDEQQNILSFIAVETKDLDETVRRANDEIKLILEYRDRLIADVVTGQVDVRGWQPGPEDVVDDALLSALGDENEDVTEEEDGDGED
ncbi:putative type I restriction enzyme, S subunit [Ectopseudomonas oleovorans]|uniref:Putative type I restriction enzyme, S subunit n=1 Tax=Ectopseudomonas oleovorans TaxID=301 RepID=A0A379K0B3_ECTOL|nr:restriction endonuclease subunit S [Pseudomonas oleovorans]SUD58053.1 putative type I restriction enzyme, S subunit [Pseudomonas oleovorans]